MSIAGLRALFGGPLGAGDLVRHIYMDEAGTSAVNDVSVVVGVIVKPDEVWRRVAERLDTLKRLTVPDSRVDSLIFSAKTIYSGKEDFADHQAWPMERRLRLIGSLLSIVREENLPIAFGYCRRGTSKSGPTDAANARKDHQLAFLNCVVVADKFLREQAPSETATLVAEDLPELKDKLKRILRDTKSGVFATKTGLDVRVTHIVDSVHFTSPQDAPLLQLADVCGFTMQRYLAHKPKMGSLMVAMTGQMRPLDRYGTSGEYLRAVRNLGGAF